MFRFLLCLLGGRHGEVSSPKTFVTHVSCEHCGREWEGHWAGQLGNSWKRIR